MSLDSAVSNGFLKGEGALEEALRSWISIDKNKCTQNELSELLRNLPASITDLKKRFLNRLEFGTAGLRAVMGCGYSCMNDVTVLQTSQGLATYLLQKFGAADCKARGVVVGFDGRHNSCRFAGVTAAVFLKGGFKVYLHDVTTATPINPFCVLQKNCVAGIQVTASHNPKADNGYKVYSVTGAQINTPMDKEVAALIRTNLCPWEGVYDMVCLETGLLKDWSLVVNNFDEISDLYMKTLTENLLINKDVVVQSPVKITYTAMHGVGSPFLQRLLENFGYTEPRLQFVAEQRDPDPEFSTVTFPNPEEKGALDLAMKHADVCGSPIVIANDPDADRFACAEKIDGKWRVFTGDELGSIFGRRMIEIHDKKGTPRSKMLLICSAVSSRMLSKICKVEGCQFEETMTGFKWMMSKAIEMEGENCVPIFVYEEALGYACDKTVRDKDGVAAAAVWVELVCELYSKGKTIRGHYEELQAKYGCFVSNNSYFICSDKVLIETIFNDFRNGGKYCESVGKYSVKRIRDCTTGYDSASPDGKGSFPVTPTSQMITLFFENGALITFRTSGTEPKLKYYSEFSAPTTEVASAELKEVVKACVENILKPQTHGLVAAG